MLCMEGALFRALVGSNSGANVQKACCAASSAVALAAWLTVVLQPKQCGERGLGCCVGRVFEFRDPSKGSAKLCGWACCLPLARQSTLSNSSPVTDESVKGQLHTICAGTCHI